MAITKAATRSVTRGVAISLTDNGDAPSGPSDPDFANVVLLLAFEKAAGSTTIDDLSNSDHAFTVNGGEVTGTSPITGIGSWEMNALGEYSQAGAVSADFTFDGAFTIEFSMRKPGAGGTGFDIIMGTTNGGNSTNSWFVEVGPQRGFLFHALDTIQLQYGALSPDDNVVRNYCVERSASNILRLYIDGAIVGSISSSTTFTGNTHPFNLGLVAGASWPNAVLDNVRITKGVARYEGNYTVDLPFPTQ